MGYEAISYEVTDAVATVTLNRPDRLNAINQTLAKELAGALSVAGADRSVRCVILTGAGRGFSAGLDLGKFEEGASFDAGDILRRYYHPVIEGITTIEKPVVASVNGVAAGAGASLALACDFRIASEEARFIQAFIRIGLVPDSGATYFLPRLVGYAKALEMAMLGDAVEAKTALDLGLVTRVVPAADLLEESRSFAKRLAEGPTRALAMTRRALLFGTTNDLASALENEADLQSNAVLTNDFVEGVTAFIEKRPAAFRGQ